MSGTVLNDLRKAKHADEVTVVTGLLRSHGLSTAERAGIHDRAVAIVEAARLLGYPAARILFREILPNIATPLLVHFGIMLTWAISMLAGLSFLG